MHSFSVLGFLQTAQILVLWGQNKDEIKPRDGVVWLRYSAWQAGGGGGPLGAASEPTLPVPMWSGPEPPAPLPPRCLQGPCPSLSHDTEGMEEELLPTWVQLGKPEGDASRATQPRLSETHLPMLTSLPHTNPNCALGQGAIHWFRGAVVPLSPPDGLADGPRLGLDPAPSLSGHQLPAVPLELDPPFLLQKCLFISLPILASPCVPFLLTGSSPPPSPPVPPASLLHDFGSGSPFLRSRLPSPSELALNCHRPHLPVSYLLMTLVSCYPLSLETTGAS